MSNDYETGFGKPPKQFQFKKGQSGNPRGRPKGSKNLKEDLKEELGELIFIREGQIQKQLSKQRAVIKGLLARAVKGDPHAASLIFKMIGQYLEEDGHPDDEALSIADELEILESFKSTYLQKHETNKTAQKSRGRGKSHRSRKGNKDAE